MTQVRRPDLDDVLADTAPPPEPHATASLLSHRRSRSALRIALEVGLISAGVFLGLMGEQWRENAQNRELAAESLRRFRIEILTNQKAVADVAAYHVTMKARLDEYRDATPDARKGITIPWDGIRPAMFETSAWDLALATQSLVHIDPQLAFAISRIYTEQASYAGLTGVFSQAMFLRPPGTDGEAFLEATWVYYGDVVLMEPKLLKMYDAALPQIDLALAE